MRGTVSESPSPAKGDHPLLRVDGVSVTYGRAEPVRALRDVSLAIARGESVGLVGESGSGKSTLCGALIGLLGHHGRVSTGSIDLAGQQLAGLNERGWQAVRGRQIGMVFQEASTALDPLMTVGGHLREALRTTRQLKGSASKTAALALLDEVGISDPTTRIRQYPHELSGGMRQRVQIAVALAGDPLLLIADEPTTALDVTIQSQILALIAARQHERGMSLLLVSHSLPMVSTVVDRVVVMYGGRVVESGPPTALFEQPRHPYTQALIAANLDVDQDAAIRPIPGVPVRVDSIPDGCPFAPRCVHVEHACRLPPAPALVEIAEGRHLACPVDPLEAR